MERLISSILWSRWAKGTEKSRSRERRTLLTARLDSSEDFTTHLFSLPLPAAIAITLPDPIIDGGGADAKLFVRSGRLIRQAPTRSGSSVQDPIPTNSNVRILEYLYTIV